MRLTGVSTGNAMEVGFGAFWGEDPRYFRAPDEAFGGRVRNIIKMTFVARRQDGNQAPAYARYATPGKIFSRTAGAPTVRLTRATLLCGRSGALWGEWGVMR